MERGERCQDGGKGESGAVVRYQCYSITIFDWSAVIQKGSTKFVLLLTMHTVGGCVRVGADSRFLPTTDWRHIC